MTDMRAPKITVLEYVKGRVLFLHFDLKTSWTESEKYKKHVQRVDQLHEKRVRQLSKSTFIDSQIIAVNIASCDPSNACQNSACPRCSAKLQTWFAEECDEMWADNSVELAFMSIVPTVKLESGLRQPCSSLADARRVLLAGLHQADITIAIGAFDLSWNPSATTAGERPCWHFRGLASRFELEDGRRALAEAFPSCIDVPRPIQVQPCDGRPEGFAYLLKPDFYRRLPREGKRGERNTTQKSLTVAQEVATCLELNKSGFEGRVVLIGVSPFIISDEVRLKNYVQTEIYEHDTFDKDKETWHPIAETDLS